ncbi:nucleotide-diphospho-sugar transferase, partial [Aureobasidium melanogenum]
MIFESLSLSGSQADLLLMYPQHWNLDPSSIEGHWLRKAREEYGVKLAPIQVQHFEGEHTWADSFTKLLAFNQTQYERVISLDSDANVLGHMDELFLLPRAPIAMPRAYWLEEGLSSQIAVIEPSEYQFERTLQAFRRRQESDFDMEIVNDLYARDCVIIPQRTYDLLKGEFRKKDHHRGQVCTLFRLAIFQTVGPEFGSEETGTTTGL